MASPPVILHADMDAFYAAVEQRDDPSLRGKPVIIGGQGRRGVVATASYEARKFGVHSAMPGSRARGLCPQGIFISPRMEAYAEVSEQVQGIFARYTPLIEPLSLDEAFLDVTGSRELFGSGPEIAAAIRRDVQRETQLTVSVGVAASKYVAKVASDLDKPDGLTVVEPGKEEEFLAPLSISRLWGAGRVTQGRLEEAGLRTIGDLQKLTLEQLVEWMGENSGHHFHALAHGIDPRRVEPEREAKSISHECTFEEDLQDGEQCEAVLLEQSEMVGRRLRRNQLKGRIVRLKLRFPPFETITRQRKLPTATDDDLEIFRCAQELFRASWQERPVRLLGVGVAAFAEEEGPQQRGLFADPPDQRNAEVLKAMDKIRDRFGEDAIGHGR